MRLRWYDRCRVWAGAASMLLLLAASTADAASYPNRPVTLVVAFTPGGPSDVLARIVGRKLEALLGQPFVILNRPGAGGNLAGEFVAHAPGDGYTLLVGNNSILATNAALYKRLGFDPEKDLRPIAMIGGQANILVAGKNVPVRSVAELIALAKTNPGKLNYASSGHGAASHLAAELFKARAGVEIGHVAYKGAAPALQDVVSGQVDMMFATTAAVIGHIRAGSVRALAVTTAQRTALLPELPTIAESVLPGFDAATWHGLVAPAATPDDIVALLNSSTVAVLHDADVVHALADLGVDIQTGTPQAFGAYIAAEIPKWTAVVRAAGARLE